MTARFALFILILNLLPLHALELDRIYGDSMVLQRGMPLVFRGKAKPGETITLSFGGKEAQAKADGEGRWAATLDSLSASSEGRSLVVKSAEKMIALENILVGEVWLGSGQSNMAGKVSSYAKRDPELAKLAEQNFPLIRLRVRNGWETATPETISGHSALLFAFGERLQRQLEVPIGLFVGAVGGTPSGAWIPEETFKSSDSIKAEIASFAKTYDREKAQKFYQKKTEMWQAASAKAKAEGKKVRGRKPKAPGEPGESTRGPIGGLFNAHIRYGVGFPIRGVLWDQGEAGSGVLGLDQYTCMSELIRGWRELWGQGEFPFLFVQKPSGNGNAFSNDNPITNKAESFKALPNISRANSNGSSRYLYTRLMLDSPNSWMVPACDLGASIHPTNKWGYGNRAAEVAAQKVYQQAGVQAYGPIYQSHKIQGAEVIVTFRETGTGMVTQHSDTLQGFALAGNDGQWHWAKAKITSPNTVSLKSDQVQAPTHIRFAYSADRRWANLFNKEGLPALAFTTEKR